jgi:GT2 family glycosyltransferase
MSIGAATQPEIGRPLVSISIVSHGNAAEMTALLESIARFEEPSRLQLILTGNLGNDLPELPVFRWHSVVLLRNAKPRGFASNHNAAFRYASAEFFCLLNPDVMLLEPVFPRLLEHIRAGRGNIVAPIAVGQDGRLQDSFRSLPTPVELFKRRMLGQAGVVAPSAGQLIEPDWIAGFFQLMPSRLYAQLGGMDEAFRLYLEDVDFCTRARLAGYRVMVDPSLRFQHGARRASRQDFRFFLWHLGSAMRFFASPVYRRARALKP